MRVTEMTRSILKARRESRDMRRDGWERVDESGGRLWELNRGSRIGQRIQQVRIAYDGVSLWVKVQP